MNVLHRSRRLTWLAGCAALASGLAATAVAAAPAADAQARAKGGLGINRNAVVSWGSNNIGELGDGSYTSRSLYGAVSGLGSGIAQIAAGLQLRPRAALRRHRLGVGQQRGGPAGRRDHDALPNHPGAGHGAERSHCGVGGG